jgi:hypothetical protein
MNNTAGGVLTAYYNLLNGNLIYNSVTVDVYKIDVPEGQKRHFVLLNVEGETYDGNKRSFADTTVILVDIVTMFKNNVDSSVADNIDDQIGSYLLTAPATSGLTNPTDTQILNVTRQTAAYLTEDDGVDKYYRKVSRYTQRVLQTT